MLLWMIFLFIYLEVRYDFAEGAAHEPRLGDVPEDGRRQTQEDDEEVGNGQVDDEHVGHGAHRVVAIHGQADEEVADEAHDEHETVQTDEDPLVDGGEQVILDTRDVIIVRLAVVVGARFRAVERRVGRHHRRRGVQHGVAHHPRRAT